MKTGKCRWGCAKEKPETEAGFVRTAGAIGIKSMPIGRQKEAAAEKKPLSLAQRTALVVTALLCARLFLFA